MKRKIALLALLAMFAAIAASGTIAYFTSETTAHNVITSGGIGIEIRETMKNPEQGEGEPEYVDFVNQVGIMPGTAVSKIVKVENQEEESWIRVWVNTAISEPGDPITNPTIKCLPLEFEFDGEMQSVLEIDFNKEDWELGEDGYWYHKMPVAAPTVENGEKVFASTAPLFTEVKFNKNTGNEYQGCVVIIDVIAEAVQTANNGSTVFEAAGWTE